MPSVGIHPPKTPVTKGSNGIAKATTPNICKMPGPPSPFVPSPLPNIARSGMSPKGFSKKVKIEGNSVAIRGASFQSMGDMASKGTGGGLISANTHGPAKFITPGSLTVTIEGKGVHLLGEPMLNNCGPSGMPPNTGATMTGVNQGQSGGGPPPYESKIDCEENKKPESEGGKGWDDCDVKQLCAKVKTVNKQHKQGKLARQPAGRSSEPAYSRTKKQYYKAFETASGAETSFSEAWLKAQFFHPCAKERWEKGGRNKKPNSRSLGRDAFQADHIHECQLGCNLNDITNFKMLSQSVNGAIGPSLSEFDPAAHSEVTLPKCDCSE